MGGACDRHCLGAGTKLEVAARELLERALVLEEDDFAVTRPADLQADRRLRHRAVADVLALRVEPAAAVRAPDDEVAQAYPASASMQPKRTPAARTQSTPANAISGFVR